MDFVDDVHLVSARCCRVADSLVDLADVVDAAVEAPSISNTSNEVPAVISRHDEQVLHGSQSADSALQFSALAKMRASVVFPVPRGPEKR